MHITPSGLYASAKTYRKDQTVFMQHAARFVAVERADD